MHALILAGGKGTRLRPLTVYTPKPIVPLANRAFLLYQLDILRKAGVSDVTLSLSYQPNKIEDLLDNGSEFGVKLRYVTEPSPLGTAGAFGFASAGIDDTSIVFNGDILTDIDLAKMMEYHRSSGSDATIALAKVEDPSRYGLVKTSEDGKVEQFIEKPKPGTEVSDGTNTINAGIYILEPKIRELIEEGQNSSFEYDIFPAILSKGMTFNTYLMDGEYWRDIGTPDSYLDAHMDILSGRVAVEKPNRSDSLEASPTAFVDNASILGDGCALKPNASVKNSVLGVGIHIEEKATIEDSVIWPHCRISTFAEIKGAVIGRGCHIGRNARIRPGSVIGDKAVIPDYSVV